MSPGGNCTGCCWCFSSRSLSAVSCVLFGELGSDSALQHAGTSAAIPADRCPDADCARWDRRGGLLDGSEPRPGQPTPDSITDRAETKQN